MREMQKQFFNVNLEVRSVSEDADRKVGTFEGYGSVFGVEDSYGDIVERGAFSDSLSKFKPKLLWQHDMRSPVGIYPEMYEDARGLYLKGELNLDVQRGREAYALLKQGAISGLSIGFITEDYEMDTVKNIRRIKKVRLLEVSLVTFPANEQSNILNVKSELPKTEREFERFLHGHGFGRNQSKAITSNGFKGFLAMQRDAANEANQSDLVQRDADMTEEVVKDLTELLVIFKKGLQNVRRSKKSIERN